MRLSSDTRRGRLLQEAFVVAHHQLRLELFHRVERHADDDEDRGPAEVERGRGLADEDRRQRRDRREVQRPREREPREDAVEELGRRAPRPHPRDEPAVLLEVVGLVDRIEGHRRVEVREEDDEDRLADDVGRLRRGEEVRKILRPGRPTAEFLDRILARLTFPGALYLAAVAALPTLLVASTGATRSFYFGGTSLLIVVGVALDTMKQLEAQLMMRNYEGFLK